MWDDSRVNSAAGTSRSQPSPSLVRRTDDRVIAGVCSGIAARLGLEPSYVRAAFVVLGFAGGVGALAYAIGWAATAHRVVARVDGEPSSLYQRVGLGFMFLGLLLLLRGVGLWFGDTLVWPILLVAFGLAVMWDRSGRDNRFVAWAFPGLEEGTRPTAGRMIIGGGIMVAGLSLIVSSVDAFRGMGVAILAVLITGGGLTMLFGPWIWRLAADLSRERTDRIRSDERADVAAHLHDSVLQTLALIQRADDSRRMVTLARAQERELRTWLFERSPDGADNRLSTALAAIAGRVEATYDIPVEVITAGDAVLDSHLEALVGAAGEAVTNAARHSGATQISLYAETSPDSVDIWVSDQGKGFDTESVPPDRHGIVESIVGRARRHGGEVEITSEPGEGTEVHLRIEREVP